MSYHFTWGALPGAGGGIGKLAMKGPLGPRPPGIKSSGEAWKAGSSSRCLKSFMALLGDDVVGLFVLLGVLTKDAQVEFYPRPGDE